MANQHLKAYANKRIFCKNRVGDVIMEKMLILGLDGLEISLVEKMNLQMFKQEVYGTHSIDFLSATHTPIVWGCFITGKNVENYGMTLDNIIYERNICGYNPILRPFYKLRYKFLRNINLGIRPILTKLGLFKPTYIERIPDKLREDCFPELIKKKVNSLFIEVPSYSESISFRNDCLSLIGKPLKARITFVEKVFKECIRRIKVARGSLNTHDFVFVYLPLPDVASHLFYDVFSLIKLTYMKLYRLLLPLMDEAYELGFKVLIVSDHGFDFKNHTHKKYGFYSFNFHPPFRPKTIMDFKEIILNLFEEDG